MDQEVTTGGKAKTMSAGAHKLTAHDKQPGRDKRIVGHPQ